jgi:sulfite reductase (ferredoxin)
MVETVEEETEGKGPTGVEIIKAASDYLRGTLAEEFADPQIFISDAAYQLLKFHGSYQQDDRDLRNDRRRAGETYAFSFMVRLRLPGGDVHPDLFLALDRLADDLGNGTLRLTTRQSVQVHGIGKHDLRTVIRTINAELSSTLGACGDVNRNVMASSAPLATPAYQLVREAARRISTHLLPRSGAYAELWLDADEAGGGQELARIGAEGGPVEGNGPAAAGAATIEADVEPLYGRTYLPRKFKTAVAVAGDNSVDLFTNDLGLVPIFEADRHVGWNVYVGGGLGRTHRKPETFPRLADALGFVGVDDLLTVAEAVVIVQRDHGDRSNRRHARLKYLIHDRGIDWFRERVEEVSGLAIEPARPVEWTRGDDLLGWREQGDGRWFLGLRVMNGRLADRTDGPRWRSALRQIATELRVSMRITPNQNLYLLDVSPAQRFRVDAILASHGVESGADTRGLRRLSMACPALPTCGLAVTEAERALPDVLDSLQETFDAVGVSDAVPTVRMTGCPNGCARPYVAEIGLVGDAVERYQVWLGGDSAGTRLARHVADRVHRDQLPALIEPLLVRYRDERLDGEAFGDFFDRVQPELPVLEPMPRPVRHERVAEAVA